MRRIKKNKRNNFVIFGIAYIVILLTISTAYSFLNTDLSMRATAGISTETDNYETDYFLQAKWNDSSSYWYHYVPTLTYLGSKETIGWKLYVEVPYDTEIVGCWNASSCVVSGEVLTISNASYNQKLSPTNSSVTPSFQMKTSKSDYTLKIIGASFDDENSDNIAVGNIDNNSDEATTVETVNYIVPELNVTGGWGNVSTYVFKVTNTSSDVSLSSWTAKLVFPSNSTISSLWGGEYSYDEASGILTLHGPSWAPTLNPNSSVEVNVFMTTEYPAGYVPKAESFTAKTNEGNNIVASITGGTS